ncbi:hypothetical protein ZOSMA_78G00430 [Zostera marina]|uniref:Uncharacterized protein n=1 Tax=Zostera marina TaxID=29655 RepID=A0A0K9NQM9_ZOSMR|nr:hypothetical protein ZOSMA_78G00430 [Zostera marina]
MVVRNPWDMWKNSSKIHSMLFLNLSSKPRNSDGGQTRSSESDISTRTSIPSFQFFIIVFL